MQQLINQPFNCFRGKLSDLGSSQETLEKSWLVYNAGKQDAPVAPDNIAKGETPVSEGRLLPAKEQSDKFCCTKCLSSNAALQHTGWREEHWQNPGKKKLINQLRNTIYWQHFALGAGKDIKCHYRCKESKRALCIAQSGRQYQTHLWLLPFFSWGTMISKFFSL